MIEAHNTLKKRIINFDAFNDSSDTIESRTTLSNQKTDQPNIQIPDIEALKRQQKAQIQQNPITESRIESVTSQTVNGSFHTP
jgi:hypothetical protein